MQQTVTVCTPHGSCCFGRSHRPAARHSLTTALMPKASYRAPRRKRFVKVRAEEVETHIPRIHPWDNWPREQEIGEEEEHKPVMQRPPTLENPVRTIEEATAIPQMWDMLASRHGDALVIMDPHPSPAAQYSFKQMAGIIRQFASGLHTLGINKGDKVSLFSENSSRWLIADQAIMMCGAVGAVRGVLSIPTEELKYIMTMSESEALVVSDPAVLDRLVPILCSPEAEGVELVITLWGEPSDAAREALAGKRVLTFDQVLDVGADSVQSFRPPPMSRDDLATLCYTSGTTGHPKAAMLTHGNLLRQLEVLDFLGARPGQRTVTYLPSWHMYGRTLEYYLYSRGVCGVYSNLRRLKDDLEKYHPNMFISVPLMLDNLHSKLMNSIAKQPAPQRSIAEMLFNASKRYLRALRVLRGTDLKYAREPPSDLELATARATATALAPIHWLAHHTLYSKLRKELGIQDWALSGGGSLATHLDVFYEIIGLQVVVGYGLTETSPVLSVRRRGFRKNVRGSIGPPIPGIELRIVDPVSKQDLPDGEQGLILAKGHAVMTGYYKNAEATRAAFPFGDEWFDTGDLGWRAPEGVKHSNMGGSIVITGRAKDTIVLTSGENVEPQPLEDRVQVSPFIKFCVVVGHRVLGALIVPDQEALKEAAEQLCTEANWCNLDGSGPNNGDEVRALVHREISKALDGRPARERISAFEVVAEEFSVENGTLTRTMKPKRKVIMQKYKDELERLLTCIM